MFSYNSFYVECKEKCILLHLIESVYTRNCCVLVLETTDMKKVIRLYP